MAAIPVLAAAKGGLALDQMSLSANGARDFLNALEPRGTRLLGLVLPARSRWRFGLGRLALLDGNAPAAVVTQHIQDDFPDHLFEFIDELSWAVLPTLYLA